MKVPPTPRSASATTITVRIGHSPCATKQTPESATPITTEALRL
jgi:hypothetical protein